ncbi:MAG TPA: YbhB/YbcL family Raf kinase inhibitor-like protein [Actinomycetes bacterium]|nr:YbhB/YbcL family Raf kinase inhibitor-like protein [Actinomycetes bacterium]
MRRYAVAGFALALLSAGCGGNGGEVESTAPAAITVTSQAFAEGEPIPQLYSCRGRNVSPPLSWSGVPAQASALALVVDDPDAPRGTFTHWVVADFAPTVTSLGEGEVPPGGVQAKNSAGNPLYTGPCPPSGTHRYRFTVYALSDRTGLTGGADLDEAQRAIADHAIAQGTLTGTFAA